MTKRASDATRCTTCRRAVPADATLCPHCGAALTPRRETEQCPSCGARLLPGQQRCPICGAHRPVAHPLPVNALSILLGLLALALLAVAVVLLQPKPEVVTTLLPSPTPSSTSSATATRTASPTRTSTDRPSPTASVTPSPTATPTSEYDLYVAVRGDSVLSVARKYGISEQVLRELNGLGPNSDLVVGQELAVPHLPEPATVAPVVTIDASRLVHMVQEGENLLRIAEQYGVTVASILEANDMTEKDVLDVGEELIIVGARATGDATPTPTPSPSITPTPTEVPPVIYVVVAGDNLGKIALRYGVTEQDIARANGITSESILSIGQRLTIPRAVATPLLSATPSLVPSETPTPSLTPSITPTPTATWDLPPSPTPLPARDYPQPQLLAPTDGGLVSGAESALLNWTSVGLLADGETYLVRLWYGPERHRSLSLESRSPSVRLPAAMYAEQTGWPVYWQVLVIRGRGALLSAVAVSPDSAVRSFFWR